MNKRIKNHTTIETFGMLFGIFLIGILVIIGILFKKFQHETDLTICYEKNKSQLRINLLILEYMKRSCPDDKNIQDEIAYIRGLLS